MSITRCSSIAKALGQLQGNLARAIEQFDRAAQGWHEYQFPDCELDALRDALNKVVRATTVVQERFAFYADAFFRDHPAPKPLLPPAEVLPESNGHDTTEQAGANKADRRGRKAKDGRANLS